jgi:hypothetical protein
VAFKIPQKAKAATAQGSGSGGYLSLSKLENKSSVRIHLLGDEPLDFYQTWIESPDGSQIKPLRFVDDPSPSDIAAEMGDFVRRQNYEKTGPDPVTYSMAFFVWNYSTEEVQLLQLTQKGLIRELDQLLSMEDYQATEDWDFVISKDTSGPPSSWYSLRPAPIKKGSREVIDAKWAEAQDKGYNLQELLLNGNPFGGKG